MIQDQVEDLQNSVERQRKELKKRKDKETSLQAEMDDFREELSMIFNMLPIMGWEEVIM